MKIINFTSRKKDDTVSVLRRNPTLQSVQRTYNIPSAAAGGGAVFSVNIIENDDQRGDEGIIDVWINRHGEIVLSQEHALHSVLLVHLLYIYKKPFQLKH